MNVLNETTACQPKSRGRMDEGCMSCRGRGKRGCNTTSPQYLVSSRTSLIAFFISAFIFISYFLNLRWFVIQETCIVSLLFLFLN